MKLFCFQNNRENSLHPKRIFKEGGGVRPGDPDAHMRLWTRETHVDAVQGEGEESALAAMRREMEEQQQGYTWEVESNPTEKIPRPVTKKAKERLKQRTVSEIFGDRETQEHYIEGVRNALEALDGDRLHDFIMAHKEYGKSSFRQWNADLDKLLGFEPAEKYRGRNKRHTQRRICAGLQHVLVDFYNTDVFQITQKKINPWIFIDGKLGPYSVSVLAEYWTSKYGATSKKTPNPPGDSGLNPKSYRPEGPAAKLYQEAQEHLDVQLERSETESDQNPPEGDPANHLSEEVSE